nr:MAG TPA: hypothetical protein [Caudoviricetes sp.]
MKNTINVKSRKEIKQIFASLEYLHPRRAHILHFRHPKGLGQTIATQARRIAKRVEGWTSGTYEWRSTETTVVLGKQWVVDRLIGRPGDVYISSIDGHNPMYFLFYMEPVWHGLARAEAWLNYYPPKCQDHITTLVDSSRVQEFIRRIPEIFEKYTQYDWVVSVVPAKEDAAFVEIIVKKEK